MWARVARGPGPGVAGRGLRLPTGMNATELRRETGIDTGIDTTATHCLLGIGSGMAQERERRAYPGLAARSPTETPSKGCAHWKYLQECNRSVEGGTVGSGRHDRIALDPAWPLVPAQGQPVCIRASPRAIPGDLCTCIHCQSNLSRDISLLDIPCMQLVVVGVGDAGGIPILLGYWCWGSG